MHPQNDTVLSLCDVGVRYKRRGGLLQKPEYFQALKNVSFDLRQGETLGIVGRNGAGKSTLLRVMAGIIRPDQGRVINYGVSVSLLALQAGFDPELPGRDNAIMNGMLLGYTRRQVEARMTDIVAFSELGDFIDEPVKTYSSGMRSRLGFSVSVFMTPDVLLLDEILSVGDRGFREKAESEMTRKMSSDQTIVLVSHSENQINRLCDRVICL
ncbi:ABC transporter ATP-binding protein [Marinobacter koreensis]|jgi:lipopolysaccharide transport system ATP-binding protein|uniref:ABC transporter ATP-binding protein n=1 Tax=Marinobacter koreensis TaxID=335974 RepID=A0ABW0RI53_9GAMM|nr:ABC transporter ATP-binding protein [Marinobacter koreensis]MCK7546975.1 ABC transporter ATP-binding protein [Marinobacter koreensis]